MFLNAELQDIGKLRERMQADPIGTSMRAFTFITLPAIINWAANHDNPEYQAREDYEKAFFYHVPKSPLANQPMESLTGGGQPLPGPAETREFAEPWVRIPRAVGTSNALLGYGVEKLLDVAHERDPQGVRDFVAQLVEQTPLRYNPIQPNPQAEGGLELNTEALVPSAVAPLVEVANNRSFFFNRPIEFDFEREIQTPMGRGLERSSPLGQVVAGAGRAAGFESMSPPVADHLLRAYGGGLLGTVREAAIDPAIRDLNERSAGRLVPGLTEGRRRDTANPLAKAFQSRAPSGFGAKPYREFRRNMQLAKTVGLDAKRFANNPVALQRLVAEYGPLAELSPRKGGGFTSSYDRMKFLEDRFKSLRDRRKAVLASSRPEEEKKDEITKIDQMVTQWAVKANLYLSPMSGGGGP